MTDWIDEIEARERAATPGPWTAMFTHSFDEENNCSKGYTLDGPRPAYTGRLFYRDDAEFAAHARIDIPRLIARVRALELQVARDSKVTDACVAWLRAIGDLEDAIADARMVLEETNAVVDAAIANRDKEARSCASPSQ